MVLPAGIPQGLQSLEYPLGAHSELNSNTYRSRAEKLPATEKTNPRGERNLTHTPELPQGTSPSWQRHSMKQLKVPPRCPSPSQPQQPLFPLTAPEGNWLSPGEELEAALITVEARTEVTLHLCFPPKPCKSGFLYSKTKSTSSESVSLLLSLLVEASQVKECFFQVFFFKHP